VAVAPEAMPVPHENYSRDAVVRVMNAEGRFCGTAFFVSPRAAVTCRHVVADLPREQIRLLGPWPGGQRVPVVQAHLHAKADLAVLEVEEPNRIATPMRIHVGWPVEGDQLTLCGYSSTFGPFEPRPFQVAAYEGGMFSMQDQAAKGMSGGPVVNNAGAVVGIGSLINDRHLTFFIPLASALDFLRNIPSIGLVATGRRGGTT